MSGRVPIDVLVIGGYLGAGKTTLVNHLLQAGTGRRTLVLVNDFGSIAVDDSLVESLDGGVLTLANGCVCCGMSSPLIDMLVAVREQESPPELVVVENRKRASDPPPAPTVYVPDERVTTLL